MDTKDKELKPLVSVCLPNLNNKPFLDERLDTIFKQTYSNWELIVVDNYSDDGAWELFQKYSEFEPKMNISQAPKGKGMYCNWNNCIRKASGEYIYIATSDDTMSPDCLEKMVAVLEKNPEGDICHCCLEKIDEKGDLIKNSWEGFPSQKFYNDLTFKLHKRKAPIDGILHFACCTVYTSITQLLIRKKVFDMVGLFRSDWGSVGDFEWEMRASLVCSTIHIPEYLASWRVHSNQATSSTASVENRIKMIDMSREAVKILSVHNNKFFVYLKSNFKRMIYIYELEKIIFSVRECILDRSLKKLLFCLKLVLGHPLLSLYLMYSYICGMKMSDINVRFIKKKISLLGLNENIIEIIEK